ncbi:MAG TPA: DUF2905 domain-containing protein [Polyangiales bacterium]
MTPRLLITLGCTIALVGLCWWLAERLGMGRLPGDIVVKRKNFTVYVPLVSSLVLSLVVTLLLNLFRK